MKYKIPEFRVRSVVRDGGAVRATVQTVENVAEIMSDIKTLDREQVRVVYLNARSQLIGWEMISQGTLTASLAHPREIFKGAILAGSAGIILVHNHPSGDPSPSDEDGRLTSRIKQCGNIIGIDVLDHLIIAADGRYSFKSDGRL